MGGSKPIRESKSKWFVSKDVYPDEKYPDYCSGSSYLMNTNDAKKIYSVSNQTNFFWIDDVFVTGILRSKYQEILNNKNGRTMDILNLNDRYHLANKNEIVDWCKKGLETNQLTVTFILLNKNDLISDMFCIWNKVRLMRNGMKICGQ